MLMIARLVYERLMTYAPTDFINRFIHSLPGTLHSPWSWEQEEIDFLNELEDREAKLDRRLDPFEVFLLEFY